MLVGCIRRYYPKNLKTLIRVIELYFALSLIKCINQTLEMICPYTEFCFPCSSLGSCKASLKDSG